VPSLGATYGRGAATMALWDIANADCVVVMGSNMDDPRFTRTSALADIHAPIRAGSDIAFLGGLIRYVIENDLWFREFALAYTNLDHLIEDAYEDPEVLDGLFSGFDPDTGAYESKSWQYKAKAYTAPVGEERAQKAAVEGDNAEPMSKGPPERDPTLQHPNCVFQILKRHYARYTPEMVEQATGCPKETFLKVAEIYAAASGRERTTTLCYAVGWTHHSVGVQIIRAGALLQGLMGNIGRPGGGVMALRGHVSIQGSTDIPTLYNMLPGYLNQPSALKDHATLERFLDTETPATGWWHNTPKYVVSLLKAWYGDAATDANAFGYAWLPKLVSDVSMEPMTLSMADGVVKGQFLLGQNPVVGAANSEMVERGMGKLEWLVVRDFAMTESGEFWKTGRRVQTGEIAPGEIGTEVFFLPAAMAGEKEGTVTNTSRMVQWHDHVCEAAGDSRSDLWFIYHLGRRLKAMYAGSDDPADAAIQALTWDYPVKGERQEPSAEAVLKEIKGYTVTDGKHVAKFQDLKDDGSTACGCWIYSGIFPEKGRNLARARKPDAPDGPGSHAGWAWAWPANRRTMYNRASADPEGEPWSERKKMIWWDEDQGRWTGDDVPDFLPDKRPDYRPDWSKNPKGMDALAGSDPFIMEADGRCAIFAPAGLKDGPLPTYYEPVESPVKNPFYGQQSNPTAKRYPRPGNELNPPQDPRFPHVLTTYRLTELHCAGIPTRIMPHTAELQPEAFVEISPELAEEIGVQNLDWTVLSTLRNEIEVKALVTERMRPFAVNGKTVHQIGMPWVFGWKGYASGASVNALLAISGDANTSINTTKALTCAIRAGRLAPNLRLKGDAA
jgi:formate dehydrogenase major subunit